MNQHKLSQSALSRFGSLTLFLVLLTIMLVMLAGSFLLPAKVQASPEDEQAQVRKVLQEQVAAWNAGDLERFLETYWKNDALSFYSGGTITTGWEATRTRYRNRYQADGKEMGTLTFWDSDVQMLASDAAMVRSRWKLTYKTSQEQPEGLFTLILRKQDQGWKIVHDHTSQSEPKKPSPDEE